jgi:hypothetical protein
MRPLLTPAILFLAAACGGKSVEGNGTPAAAGAHAVAPVAEDADCNLQTPLVPGIPGSPGHLIKSARNPNGDSELAVLMRRFVDDLREVRTRLEAKQPLQPLYPVHRKMRCSWPTRPEDRNERFDLRAQGYLASVRAFDGEPTKSTYNGMIAGCINCHSQSCGGPLDFIDGMKWQ